MAWVSALKRCLLTRSSVHLYVAVLGEEFASEEIAVVLRSILSSVIHLLARSKALSILRLVMVHVHRHSILPATCILSLIELLRNVFIDIVSIR